MPHTIYAETVTWTKENSPYTVESDLVINGDLHIEPGVTVKLGDANIDSLKVVGSVYARGTADEPIRFTSASDTKNWALQIVSGTSSEFAHVIFENSYTGLIVRDSSLVFEDSMFDAMDFCITLERSRVDFVDTEFGECRNTAIYSIDSDVEIFHSELSGNTENQGLVIEGTSLSISSSTLSNYVNALLANSSTIRIDKTSLVKNTTALSTKFSDVGVTNSLFKENNDAVSVAMVLDDVSVGGMGNAEAPTDRVVIHNSEFIDSTRYDIANGSDITVQAENNWWGSNIGPTKNAGKVKVDPWVVRGTCCSSVLFIPGFQASLLSLGDNQLWTPNRNADVDKLNLNNQGESLNSISVGNILTSGLGYDIYSNLVDMFDKKVQQKEIVAWKSYPYDWRMLPTTIAPQIVDAVEQLAKGSRTGKVAIVGHSNGGLVAKALLAELTKVGKQDIVESLTFIAVPHIGTPQAIAALQYGHGQSLGRGIVLNKFTARKFGANMPGAYGLLPSTFVVPATGVASTSKDLKQPMRLNAALATQAKNMHKILDTISFPKINSLTGWNKPTLRSLSEMTLLGDGTVLASSSNIFKNSYFLDLSKEKGISHANITQSASVLSWLWSMISGTQSSISTTTPMISKEYDHIVVKIHSPVDIHAYDSEGNHTGPALNTREREEKMGVEPGLFEFYDEDIPGSTYSDFGDVKTIILPMGDYTIKGNGTGSGGFTLETSVQNGLGEQEEVAVFAGNVQKGSNIVMGVSSTAEVTNLKLDKDGNGKYERELRPLRKNKPWKHRIIKRFIDRIKHRG